MATKGYKDNEQQAFTPTPTDWLGIQQGSLLSDMKKITYKDLTDPLQGQIDDHEQRVDDLELAEGSIKGVGWTGASLQSLDENKADKATTYTKTEVDVTIDALDNRLDTLEGTGEGSVAKAIDDAVSPLAEVVDTNRLYSDSQYLALKAKYEAQQIALNASKAELYTDDPILQYGATEIIGDGYEADDTPIDVSANVVDGKLSIEQKGLTITNLVDGADIADSGTVSFNTVNGDKYFDTLNETIITGDGTEMSATNSSGATANMAIYHLNAHGFSTITDTDILAQLLPYVDGTANVGKMGVRVVGKNLFDMTLPILANRGACTKTLIPDGMRITNASGTFARVGFKVKVTAGAPYTLTRTAARISGTSTTTAYTAVTDGLLTSAEVMGGDFTGLGTNSGSGSKSITFIAPASGVIWVLLHTSWEVANSVTVDFTNIMLNLGSTALPYTPYQEQLTFLPSIGNSLPNGVADSVKTVSDGWEHTKRVSDKIIFDNANGWEYSNENDDSVLFLYRLADSYRTNAAVVTYNNIFPDVAYNDIFNSSVEGLSLHATSSGFRLRILKSRLSTYDVDGLSEFFTNNPMEAYYQLATPVITHYDFPHLTSSKTIHRFAGEEKIALYGTGLTFSENVLSVLSAIKFVAGVMTDITSLATITGDTVTFSGVSATDVVYVKVEHDVDRPLGVLEHTPAVSNTASRLAAIEAWIAAQGA